MTLRIKWKEKGSSRFTDEIPDSMLASETKLSGVSHAVRRPGGGKFLAWCNVNPADNVVTFDYRSYVEENENEFSPGVLRLTFPDARRRGKPEVEWGETGRDDFVLIKALVTRGPISEDEVGLVSEPFDPSNLEDARQRMLKSLAVRQGQPAFRNALMAAYRNTCVVTGCRVAEVLEAAHISGYRGPHTNHVQNGLLLRADIHALFDKGLIGIDPDTWKVVVHKSIRREPYAEPHESDISSRLPENIRKRPNAEALKQHLKSFGLEE